MESSKVGSKPDSFMQQLLCNNMLMLTVLLAVCAVAYFGVSLYVLIRQ